MDILGTLNTGGSGLNIKELSETLSQAEIVPRKELISGRIDTAETRLSGYDRLRGQMDTLSEAMTMMRALSPRMLTSDSLAVGVAIADPAALDFDAATIDVDRIAQAQVLNFSGFSGPDQPIGAGILRVDKGSWSDGIPPQFTQGALATQTIDFAPGSTLSDVAQALSEIDGVTARVIDQGDGVYSLGIISDTGRNNALRLSAPLGSLLSSFDFAADPTGAQVQAAQDAELRLNGIAVTRPSNTITDLLPGVELSLKAPTTQTANITLSADVEGTLTAMQGFVDMVNATHTLVTTLTARGVGANADKGDLAGDTLAKDALSGIASILSQGFGRSDVHLADIGILTERNGSLTLDEVKFTKALTANPALLEPLFRDDLTSDTATVTGTPPAATAAGSYAFVRDPATGTATVNGVRVFGNQNDTGDWIYSVASGPLRGVTITVAQDTEAATIDFAPSMVRTLQAHLQSITSNGGTLEQREAALEKSITKETTAIEALDQRQEELRLRYLSKFTEMERIVTQLNSTADYLTNMVDAWNSDS